MKFTGERFIPNLVEDAEINIEHLQRYRSIADIVRGKRILDAASGEGYGSSFLSQYADYVYGVDISEEAIQLAQKKYDRENLEFIQGSIEKLPIPDKSVDVVVSFETIEHVPEEVQHKFLKEIGRVLKEDGILIISTPNKKIYSDIFNYNNEFHIKEFYRDEFKAFLDKYFKYHILYSQYKEVTYNITSNTQSIIKKEGEYSEDFAKYYISIASNKPLPEYNLSVTNIVNETTYIHQVQRILQIQKEIEDKNMHISKLDTELSEKGQRIIAIQDELEQKNKHIGILDEELLVRGKRIESLQDEVEEKNKHIGILDEELLVRGKRIESLQNEIEEKNKHIRTLDGEIAIKTKTINQTQQTLEESVEKVIGMGKELEESKEKQAQQVSEMNIEIESLQQKIQQEDKNLERLLEELEGVKAVTNNYQTEIEVARQQLNATNEELQRIYHSAGWKLLLKLYKTRDKIAPANSRRRLIAKLGKNILKAPKRYLKNINGKNLKTVHSWFTTKEPNIAMAELDHFDRVSLEEESKVYDVINFEKQQNPLVSIVIPVYNQWDYTYSCLQAIKNHTTEVSYEIIIADDNSTDRTKSIQKYIKNIKVVRNTTNKGFLLNCNHAAKQAEGKYIVFLNNDTNVHERWLVTLVGLIESDKTIGMVGSKLVYADGRLQEAGGIIWKDASGWNYGRLDDPNKPEYNYVREVDYISGAAIMLPRVLWEEIGGFDERYIPAYYEDTDLAFEVRKRGYKVMYQPQSVVTHFEGISNGTDINSGIKKYQQDNNKKFYDKWKDVLETHCENGQDVFKAVRNGNRKNILVIDHYVPHFDKDAGSRCTFGYVNLFKSLGLNVTFLGDNFFQHEPYTGELQQRGINVLYGNWYAQNIAQWLMENGKYFDYVYLNRPHISVKYIDLLKEYSDAKIIYFGHDLHYIRLKRNYEIEKNEELLEASNYWKEVEFGLFNKADVVYVVGDYEQKVLMNELPEKPIRNIPVYIYDHSQEPTTIGFQERNNLLFVGGFNHAPNEDGILWFTEEILPLIKKDIPGVKVYVVGSNPSEQVQALASEDVIVTGFVSDEELAELYKQSRVIVAPLRYGAGVKGKVVEAIYNQVPLVTTPIGAEGLTEIEKYVLVEDDKTAFAKQVIEVYNNQEEWERLSGGSREYIDKYFSLNTAKNIVKQDVE